ncbi:hypothetical protein Q5424_25890 [Conexibacter sp. JD483]|uniref:hypothetical protein n=1 Tax=unclassified Conexibacter TaxID=2627773 RepID=UPI002724FD85|nr:MULTISPECIES: hypothetical protein [unclassified Conexibacter]MDO8187791.1 hypothetical protein [Conexibacter sp. CPCC 205706]MDO8201979.1 hypothetical protein [Conexibacter sp. CPCC 205762]MDR9372557.1 hypothetical protein [Conexibacter sp. JD483]
MTPRSHLGRARRIALGTFAGLAGAAALLPAAATAAPAGGELFTLTSGGGSVTRRGGSYELRLDAPSARVTGFSDRPQRVATSETLRRFVAGWKARGFAADPPNAALVLDRAPRSRDTFVFELSRPRLGRGGALSFRARRLASRPAGGLRQLAKGADRAAPPRTFSGASLFVDAGDVPSYVLNLSVSLPASSVAVMEFGDEYELQPYPSDAVPTFKASTGAELILPENAIVVGGAASPLSASLQIAVAGGYGPISGTMSFSAGGSATVALGNGTPVNLPSGPFSIPIG